MKKSRLLFAVLAFVLVLALVACGGEKQPEVTEDPSAAATTTTAKADAATTTKAAPAATTTKAPVVTTTAAPVVESKRPNTLDEYKSLFVSDGNVLHLNFAEATPDSPALVGSSRYEDETASAFSRFQASASNYTDYIFNSVVENPVYGGTAKILTPWYFEDYFADWTVKMTTSAVEYLRTTEPEEYLKTATQGGKTVYVTKTFVEETDFYISNGVWAKKMYASKWGDRYLNIGLNSTLSFATAAKVATQNGSSFTIQFIAQKPSTSGSWDTFVGNRYYISSTAPGKITLKGTSSCYPDYKSVTTEIETFDITAINGYTFTYDRADLSAVNLGAYVNCDVITKQTSKEGTLDAQYKIFEAVDANVFAIRVYSKALSEAEIVQNHFADLALYLGLDITELLALDDTARAKVYEAMKTFTYDYPALLVQPILNQAVAAAK